MDAPAGERAAAVAAADRTCPRCGSLREADQGFCLECGTALPLVTGRIASLRRRWMRFVGWYPGDFVWVSLLALVVAAAGTAAAIVVSERRADAAPRAYATPTPLTVGSSTLPVAPEPATPGGTTSTPESGPASWPAGENGWTIVLVSFPKTTSRAAALRTAARAARARLPLVGILDSGLYASLQPGYLVVFSGVYASKADADGAVATARQAGFAGAYSRQIAG